MVQCLCDSAISLMTNNFSVYFKPWRNIRPSTSSDDIRGRRSARVFLAREYERSNGLSKYRMHSKIFHSQIRRPFSWGFRRNNIHPRGNPAFVRSIPAVFLQHSYPYPRETCGFRGIPAAPIPMHTSTFTQALFLALLFVTFPSFVVQNATIQNWNVSKCFWWPGSVSARTRS